MPIIHMSAKVKTVEKDCEMSKKKTECSVCSYYDLRL